MLFRFEGVTKAYGAHEVLRDVTFQVNPGDHLGLVGRNGAGKTTLFRLLLGGEDPDTGRVERQRNLRIGLLEQQVGVVREGTVREATLEVFRDLHAMEVEMRRLEHEMVEVEGDALEAVLAAYSDLQHSFEEQGGFTMHARAEAVLLGLGFSRDDLDLAAATLSGGQRARLGLARLLLEEPDVLLLDEPTNHLDIRAVEWLEEFLVAYKSAYVVISHDRFLLDRTATRIVAIDNGRASTYTGNYSAYVLQREERRLLAEKRYREQQELVERTEEFIRKNLAGQKTKQAKSRRNMLERMERVERPDSDRRSAAFDFGAAARTGREVLVTDELAIGFPGVTLVAGIDMTIERGDRVGVVGPNGAGKTTLVKTIFGKLDPVGGTYTWGHNVALAYYDQHLSDLDPSHEVIEEMGLAIPGADDPALRSYLARFLFSGDEVFKRVSALSGGERSRLSLAKLISGAGNTLLLDEPTNHLDIPSREALEEALQEFPGTLFVISHDRYFLDKICDRLVSVENGRAEVFEGTYADWAERRALERMAARANERAERDAARTPAAPQTAAASKARTKKTAKGRPVPKIEADISETEAEIADIEAAMAKPEIASDHLKLAPLTDAHARAAARLDALMSEWEHASASAAE
jgi:ATP-binding cassette subfamily F protein 3